MQEYLTLADTAEAQLVEKRSRFIALAAPVATPQAANALLSELRAKYWDASHNCYAYILREGGERYADDGEPQGTAGPPILETLRHAALTDAMIVVTRYFGGTLLGAGGLVRAYSTAARLALDCAETVRMCLCSDLLLELDYARYSRLSALLGEAQVLESAFAEKVSITLRLPSEALPAFADKLTALTAGEVVPVLLREEFAPYNL